MMMIGNAKIVVVQQNIPHLKELEEMGKK